MHTARRPVFFHSAATANPWPSAAISVAVTAAMFAVAFSAMESRVDWRSRDRAEVTPTVVIPLPISVTPPAVRPKPVTRPAPPRVVPATPAAPTSVAPNPAIDVVPPTVTAPAASTPTRRDSAATPSNATGSTSGSTAPTVRGGAPVAPAGVNLYGISPAEHAAREAQLPGVTIGPVGASRSLYSPPTPAERQEIAEGQQRADRIQRRTTTAGNSRDVHVTHGEGKDGVGAVGGQGGVGHIGVPLFSLGPSAAQRKKNEALDSEYNARLARLQERVKMKRDSILADSLRRDSLARRGRIP